METSTQHIINNQEIGLTECGRLTRNVDPASVGPFNLTGGDIAAWDDDEFHSGYVSCAECHTEYVRNH